MTTTSKSTPLRKARITSSYPMVKESFDEVVAEWTKRKRKPRA